MNRAVFIDRDGVINELVYSQEYGTVDTPHTPRQFKLKPDVTDAIKALNRLGLRTIIVSNQPGMAKRKTTKRLFERTREKMKREFAKAGVTVDGEYYCFHHPQATDLRYRVDCPCRKPKPGLILQAANGHEIDLKKSFVIGDNLTDILAGEAAGCKTILLGTLKCDLCKIMEQQKAHPTYIVSTLSEAVELIRREVEEDGDVS